MAPKTRNITKKLNSSAKIAAQKPTVAAAKVLILPEFLTVNDTDSETESSIIKLRNPKNGTEEMFLYEKKRGILFQLSKHEDGERSWFVNDTVWRDGSITLTTPMDPLFIILPYLKQSEKYRPLSHILVDDQFPESSLLTSCEKVVRRLRLIANVKTTKDITAYCYNREKCMKWLSEKVHRLSRTLQEKKMHISGGAHAATYVRNKREASLSDDDFLRYAYGMVSVYLQPETMQELSGFLGFPSETEKTTGPDLEPPKKRLRLNNEEPTEDYSVSCHQNKRKESERPRKLTTSQRMLSKVDKSGMKSISSFFRKKDST